MTFTTGGSNKGKCNNKDITPQKALGVYTPDTLQTWLTVSQNKWWRKQ